jgi:hypothetical protein
MVLGHSMMHIITAVVASILFVLSLITYTRTKKGKFLFICGAFLLFAVKEIVLAVSTVGLDAEPTSIFSTHILNLIILAMFAYGILK